MNSYCKIVRRVIFLMSILDVAGLCALEHNSGNIKSKFRAYFTHSAWQFTLCYLYNLGFTLQNWNAIEWSVKRIGIDVKIGSWDYYLPFPPLFPQIILPMFFVLKLTKIVRHFMKEHWLGRTKQHFSLNDWNAIPTLLKWSSDRCIKPDDTVPRRPLLLPTKYLFY